MYKPGVAVSVQSTEQPTADLTDISKLKIKMEQLEKLQQDMNKIVAQAFEPGVSVISYLREFVTVEQFPGFFILQRVPFNRETNSVQADQSFRNYYLIRSITQHSLPKLWAIIVTIYSLLFKESKYIYCNIALKNCSANCLSSPEHMPELRRVS